MRCSGRLSVLWLYKLLWLGGLSGCSGDLPRFPHSEFWQPIADNPALDPDSASYIADLTTHAKARGRLNLNLDQYTVAVYRGAAGTPRVNVRLNQGADLTGVPIPPDAQPAPGSDGHMVILDDAGPTAYEFWQARRTDLGWQASGGVALDLRGDGVNPTGGGVRASSLSLLLGLVTYDEVQSGAPIHHALAWAFDHPNAGYFAAPATSSDGNKVGGRSLSIPEGARVQLDPALDLSTLGLSPAGRRLAEALQRYGMFCVDNSSDSSVIGEELSARGQSWTGLLSYDDLQRLPTDRLRVLKLRNKTPIR